jgi:hypothetical protein
MALSIGYRLGFPRHIGVIRGEEIPTLTLYIHGIEDSEHEIDLKELAEALKPYLKDKNDCDSI